MSTVKLAKRYVYSSTLSFCPSSWVALNLLRVIVGWAERVYVCDIIHRIELKYLAVSGMNQCEFQV